jgi:ATP-dependent Clp protease protease subunit
MTYNNQEDIVSDVHNYGINIKTREIFLHPYVANNDEDPGVDYKMSTNFYKNIRLLESINSQPIIIHMNSIGGEWNSGVSICDAISFCKSHITIIVYGQAESMSSIILQFADKRVMMPNSYFMCHFGSSGYSGNYLDVQKGASFEKEMAETMLDIYASSCVKGKFFTQRYKNITQQKVKNYIKRKLKEGDWYLKAHDAVYYGFADCVLGTRRFPSIDSLK